MCRVALCSGSKLEFTLDGAPFRCQAWARPAGGADVEKSCLRRLISLQGAHWQSAGDSREALLLTEAGNRKENQEGPSVYA